TPAHTHSHTSKQTNTSHTHTHTHTGLTSLTSHHTHRVDFTHLTSHTQTHTHTHITHTSHTQRVHSPEPEDSIMFPDRCTSSNLPESTFHLEREIETVM